MNDEEVICTCLGITVGDIKKAVENGAKTFEEVQEATSVGNVCGLCVPEVKELIETLL